MENPCESCGAETFPAGDNKRECSKCRTVFAVAEPEVAETKAQPVARPSAFESKFKPRGDEE